MGARAVEVANEFLRLPRALGNVAPASLQQLVFLADGWSRVINQRGLVSDTPLATVAGPVYPDLYQHVRYFGSEPVGRLIRPADDNSILFFSGASAKEPPYQATLLPREREVVERVWNRYGQVDSEQLGGMNYVPGSPWLKAFERGPDSPIRPEDIEVYFEGLVQQAMASASRREAANVGPLAVAGR